MGFFDKRSLEEIERDNAKLRAEAEVREDFTRRDAQRAKASSEGFKLRHAGKVRMVKKVGKGVGWVGRRVGAGITALGEQYAKAEASKQPPKRKRRVKKVKKRKKKQNSFTITYN